MTFVISRRSAYTRFLHEADSKSGKNIRGEAVKPEAMLGPPVCMRERVRVRVESCRRKPATRKNTFWRGKSAKAAETGVGSRETGLATSGERRVSWGRERSGCREHHTRERCGVGGVRTVPMPRAHTRQAVRMEAVRKNGARTSTKMYYLQETHSPDAPQQAIYGYGCIVRLRSSPSRTGYRTAAARAP